MIMNETTGKIKTNGHLDREMNASFSFTVIAKDLGEPSRSASVSIYITVEDYNDEYPEFNKRIYEFSIVENPVQGYYIDTIIVSDKDIDVNSELSFHLDYNDEEDITYMNNGNDNRYHQQYELRFPLYKQKRLPPFKLTSKRLNDQHTYELNLFTNGKIDREEIIRLNQRKLKIALEYNDYKNMNSEEVEELSRYKLLLTAEDSGMPKRISTVLIYINIIDVNDEAPIFISPLQEDMIYTLSINEAPGYQVLKFKANDPDDGINAKIKYSLTELSQTKLYNENESLSTCETLSFKSLKHQNTSCNLLQYLYLNQSSGSLTLIKQLPLNLLNTTCRLRVEASDMGIIPLQTTRLFCLHLMTTNDLKQVKWMSYTKQYTHSILLNYIINICMYSIYYMEIS
uniref:Cadherin domain-containing protein n=1 Tax=Trichobilharzia regenti TaxID=157069 RepID=A0AA85KIK9_TRIRE|nr:unnamed protein product [Trichobilharzia regenti]